MPIKTHTNAAASFPGAMRKLLTGLSLTIAAFVCGVTLGYFVIDAPIIPVATASAIEWLVPLVKEIDAWLYVRKAEYLVVAVLVFVANVPNVALLSILVALSMKWLRKPRWVFYSTLLWPIYHFFLDARQLVRFMANLERRGLTHDLDSVLRAENLPTKAVGMLLVYSLFSILVFLVYRWLSRSHKDPLRRIEAPTVSTTLAK